MQQLLASRITLTPRPLEARNAVLEVAMLGHCPGPVRIGRLLALRGALSRMRSLGFGDAVDQLEASSGDPRILGLQHLPIPLRSSAEFHDIFPGAQSADTGYVSVLAGRRAWLPQCVDDFFANGGDTLWVIAVPENEGQSGFLPAENTRLHEISTLRGLACALAIPTLATVAFPDLERLQVPARLPDIPRVRLDNPSPQFVPCGTDLDDDHRERRYSDEVALGEMPPPAAFNRILQGILPWLAKHRPDLQCLLTLPLSYNGKLDSPAIDARALQWIREIRDGDTGARLRQTQFLFPYLRGPGLGLSSPVGIIAGKQAAQAQARGPWRSIAGLPLQSAGLPYPPLSVGERVQLRNDPGVGVLQQRNGQLQLDDERLVVPALHPDDYSRSQVPQRFDGYRSAEVMRLLGYLRRQLNALGEQLIFNLDYRDPRPRLLLERFFRQLQQRGALRGATAEEAFRIEESQTREGVMIYEIMIAPAFPVDRIHLTFINRQGEWQGRVNDD
ncbi:hypothetical protein GCM10011348_02950 [Marinobacterium nitratireducens]|uniref:Uncharacterized protein n=1 Tax=Marinobacterium nitratireducens TaxID=518897 RepID=A0A917Z7K4_9GAMM|nr:hypothetical protein [Marinobacterium nitratireducens]GGO76233.1 hypothetical protein GCM10011348_02950 [Marinobacterium nitratireducens]